MNDDYKKFHNFICDQNISFVENHFKKEYLSVKDKNGESIIHIASLNDSSINLVFLLENGANIEECNNKGWRPIHYAMWNGSIEVVKSLIGHNCQLDCKTNKDETPIDIVKDKTDQKYLDVVNLIHMAMINRPIGLSMGLKCSYTCDHSFCLQSFSVNIFDESDLIGVGTFGSVYKITRSQDNQEFAYKKLVWTEVPVDREKDVDRKALGLEIDINEISKHLQHERIVKYYGVLRNLNNMFIFMEYIEDSLDKRIKNDKTLSYNLIAKYTKQILECLVFLHENEIIHRDIKSSNVLLDKNDNCKLTDFGLSKFVQSISIHGSIMKGTKTDSSDDKSSGDKENLKSNDNVQTLCDTVNYMSPEMMNGEDYDYLIDIWSLGATIIEMITGNPPFHDKPQNYIILQVRNHKKIEYKQPDNMPEDLKLLIKEMLNPDKKTRKTAKDLLKFDWINS